MKNKKFNYSDNIIITIDDKGEPLYNGLQSLFLALVQIYPNFKNFKAAKQMQIFAEAVVELAAEPLQLSDVRLNEMFPPKTFLYELVHNYDGSAWIRIIEEQTGILHLVLDEEIVMTLEKEFGDLQSLSFSYGLRAYLVKTGELLPEDILIKMIKDQAF